MDVADDSSLVAPLLQRVAADVSHFVKMHGYLRMPTRSEMHSEGEIEILHFVITPLCSAQTP